MKSGWVKICLELGVLAGEEFVCLLVLGHGIGDDFLWQGDTLALVESNGLEVVTKVLLIEAIVEKGSITRPTGR
jgi:hypothetical protein